MIQFYLLSVLLNLLAGFYMFFSAHDAGYDEISPIDSDEDNSSIKTDSPDKSGNLFSRIVGISENFPHCCRRSFIPHCDDKTVLPCTRHSDNRRFSSGCSRSCCGGKYFARILHEFRIISRKSAAAYP